jgi:hypothetical protein
MLPLELLNAIGGDVDHKNRTGLHASPHGLAADMCEAAYQPVEVKPSEYSIQRMDGQYNGWMTRMPQDTFVSLRRW